MKLKGFPPNPICLIATWSSKSPQVATIKQSVRPYPPLALPGSLALLGPNRLAFPSLPLSRLLWPSSFYQQAACLLLKGLGIADNSSMGKISLNNQQNPDLALQGFLDDINSLQIMQSEPSIFCHFQRNLYFCCWKVVLVISKHFCWDFTTGALYPSVQELFLWDIDPKKENHILWRVCLVLIVISGCWCGIQTWLLYIFACLFVKVVISGCWCGNEVWRFFAH